MPLKGQSPDVGKSPKLLDKVRNALRTEHYFIKTEKAYYWIRKYNTNVLRRKWRKPEIRLFLNHLDSHENVAVSMQNQALCALVFLYK